MKCSDEKIKVKWKTESCGESNCWCEMIYLQNCEEDSCVVGSGILHKEVARHIVSIHNKHIDLFQD